MHIVPYIVVVYTQDNITPSDIRRIVYDSAKPLSSHRVPFHPPTRTPSRYGEVVTRNSDIWQVSLTRIPLTTERAKDVTLRTRPPLYALTDNINLRSLNIITGIVRSTL